ncbi:hypothetical protein [Rhizobium phage RHEph24]|nr:hypothetical protein [Rhizobium phage RHEph24]
MRIAVEIEIPDELVEHPSIAQKLALIAHDGIQVRHWKDERINETVKILTSWEFKKHSGSMNNERNPS